MSKYQIYSLAAAFPAAVVLHGCGGDDDEDPPNNNNPPTDDAKDNCCVYLPQVPAFGDESDEPELYNTILCAGGADLIDPENPLNVLGETECEDLESRDVIASFRKLVEVPSFETSDVDVIAIGNGPGDDWPVDLTGAGAPPHPNQIVNLFTLIKNNFSGDDDKLGVISMSNTKLDKLPSEAWLPESVQILSLDGNALKEFELQGTSDHTLILLELQGQTGGLEKVKLSGFNNTASPIVSLNVSNNKLKDFSASTLDITDSLVLGLDINNQAALDVCSMYELFDPETQQPVSWFAPILSAQAVGLNICGNWDDSSQDNRPSYEDNCQAAEAQAPALVSQVLGSPECLQGPQTNCCISDADTNSVSCGREFVPECVDATAVDIVTSLGATLAGIGAGEAPAFNVEELAIIGADLSDSDDVNLATIFGMFAGLPLKTLRINTCQLKKVPEIPFLNATIETVDLSGNAFASWVDTALQQSPAPENQWSNLDLNLANQDDNMNLCGIEDVRTPILNGLLSKLNVCDNIDSDALDAVCEADGASELGSLIDAIDSLCNPTVQV